MNDLINPDEEIHDSVLEMLNDSNLFPALKESEIGVSEYTKIPFSRLAALGTSFQPLTQAVQTAITGSGGSGIYFVNTNGKTMFQKNSTRNFVGSLMNIDGSVGGGQADLIQLACDPTMLFMAATLANIDKKLDTIQQMQQEMMDFLVLKEKSELKGSLNVLYDILKNYQYNWDNEMYKNSNHSQVLNIKKDAEDKIVFFRERIISKVNKKSFFHGNQSVKKQLEEVQEQFEFYQTALYILAFSSFLDLMLVENFGNEYLNSICEKLEEYSYQYRELYTTCYDKIENHFSSSVESTLLKGMSKATSAIGKVVEKMPVISKTQIDENLISAGDRINEYGIDKIRDKMNALIERQNNFVRPFIDSINAVNELHNRPVQLLIDKDNLYIGALA